MNEAEYRDFLRFLFERYVRPQLARVRDRHMHHGEWEFFYYLNGAVRAARMVRFLEADCRFAEDIYRTFTLERIEAAVSGTASCVEFSNNLTDAAGFLDAIDLHLSEIAGGLSASNLPEADENVLREMGSVDPKAALRGLVYRAKRWMEGRDRQGRDTGLRQELQYAEAKLKKEAADFQERIKAKKEQPSPEIPKKGRPWFKGIGQISEGAALSIANLTLATGTLQLPVSPETQTWGSITSVSVGLSTVLSGIGELRNE